MYNRYIPQPDGTYRRNRMSDPQPPSPPAPQPQRPCPEKESAEKETILQHQMPPCENRTPPQPRRQKNLPSPSAGSFLRQLLPADLNTEDLLVIVLLLLMAGDSQDERNNALLTLALYLFL